MTQPIRLDDVVIVEGEWGRVEEITLTYVIIHIWDDRRLVVPLSYFIEKPFQNWTRVSAQLLGSVFVWVDYSLPLDEARKALKEIIESQSALGQTLLEFAGDRRHRKNHANPRAGHLGGFLQGLGFALRHPRATHRLDSETSSAKPAATSHTNRR